MTASDASFNNRLLLLWLTLALGATLYAAYNLVDGDAASYLGLAELYLHGKHLYKQILDTNTPLIVYLSLLPVLAHHLTGLSTPAAFFILVFALLQGCIFLSFRILRPHPLLQSRAALIAAFAGLYDIFFILPDFSFSFGQREHLLCMLILPYLCLGFLELSGIEPQRRHRILAGVLAGIGFSIKPHFALIFMVAEGFRMVAQKNLFAWKRPETLLILAISVLYYASMLILSPDYFTHLLPLFAANYKGYQAETWSMVKSVAGNMLPALILLAFALRPSPYRRITLMLFSLTMSAVVIYAVGLCAYNYRLYPILFFEVLMATTLALPEKRWGLLALFLALHAALVGYQTRATNAHQPALRAETLALVDIMRKEAHGEPVAFLSSSVKPAFPAVVYADTPWGMTLTYLQYLPTPYMAYRGTPAEPPYHALNEMPQAERFFYETTIADMEQLPRLVFVNKGQSKQGLQDMRFDYLHYFMRDPRFAGVWARYRLLTVTPEFDVYARR